MGVSDVSERGGEDIRAQSSEMEAFTEEDGEGIIIGESLDKGEVIQLG